MAMVGAISGALSEKQFRPGPKHYYRFETSPREWQQMNELCAEMQEPGLGVLMADRQIRGQLYRNCFAGNDLTLFTQG